MSFRSNKSILAVGLAHAAFVVIILLVGWLETNLVFSFFALLALDFPLSLTFDPIADNLLRFSGSQDRYQTTEVFLATLYLVIGSLWYCLLAILVRKIWRSDNFLSAGMRKLWRGNTR